MYGLPTPGDQSCPHKKVFIPIRQQLIYKSIWGDVAIIYRKINQFWRGSRYSSDCSTFLPFLFFIKPSSTSPNPSAPETHNPFFFWPQNKHIDAYTPGKNARRHTEKQKKAIALIVEMSLLTPGWVLLKKRGEVYLFPPSIQPALTALPS